MLCNVLDKQQQISNKYHVGTHFNQEREKNLTVQNRHLAIHRHDRKCKEKNNMNGKYSNT